MGVKGKKYYILFPTLITFLYIIFSSHAQRETDTDTLFQGQELKDGEQLVSSNNVFALRFFTPQLQQQQRQHQQQQLRDRNRRSWMRGYIGPEHLYNRYLGIFYKDSDYDQPVWIVNRDNPILGRSGSLIIDNYGVLKILQDGSTFRVVSSSGVPNKTINVVVVLMDTGNLVLSEVSSNRSSGRVRWQSFDYPTDTLIPGMRLRFRLGAEQEQRWNWNLTSWESDKVPARGSFTLGADPNGTAQLIIWKKGKVYWKSGMYSSQGFENLYDHTYKFGLKSDEQGRFFVLYQVHDWRITSPMLTVNNWGILSKSEPEYNNSIFRMIPLIDCYAVSGFDLGQPGCVRY